MAKNKTSLKQGVRNDDIPPIVYGEQGYTGLIVQAGNVVDGCQEELRFPKALQTYQLMMQDPVIAAATELIGIMLTRPTWTVKIPYGYEEELKDKAEFLKQCMSDMDHTWQDFIKQAITAFSLGFSVHEIVLKYRRTDKGSKFNDGLVGIKKLPMRAQDTITKWEWSKDLRELRGLYQAHSSLDVINNGWDFVSKEDQSGEKYLKRKKFLLFRNNPNKDSPIGKSPLDGAWKAWKYKTAYEKTESKGVATDVHGFKILYLPYQYMEENASESYKQSYAHYKQAMNNIDRAAQNTMILPLLTDDEGNRTFDFEVKNLTGNKAYDVNKIIARYTSEILTCLFADFLALGSNGSGSFSLADAKFELVLMVIESKLNEIKDQLNHQLVRILFEENGWDTAVMPYFDYGSLSKVSMEELGSFVQKTRAVGMLPDTVEVINWIMATAGVPHNIDPDIKREELKELLNTEGMESRSGDGMKEGLGNGTGKSTGSSGDASTANKSK